MDVYGGIRKDVDVTCWERGGADNKRRLGLCIPKICRMRVVVLIRNHHGTYGKREHLADARITRTLTEDVQCSNESGLDCLSSCECPFSGRARY